MTAQEKARMFESTATNEKLLDLLLKYVAMNEREYIMWAESEETIDMMVELRNRVINRMR